MSDSLLTRAERIRTQAEQLLEQVQEDIKLRHFETDEVRMDHYNTLLRNARRVFPEDEILEEDLSTLPDDTLRSFPVGYLFEHPDTALNWLKGCVTHLRDHLDALIMELESGQQDSTSQSGTWYQEGSPAHAIVQLMSGSWNLMKSMAGSQLLSDRLLAYNALFFTLVSSIGVTHLWLGGDSVFSISGLLVFAISFAAAFIISNPYIKLMRLVIDLAKDKVGNLRIADMMLSTGLPLASAGLLYDLAVLTQIALSAIVVQIVYIAISNTLFTSSNTTSEDTQITGTNLRQATGKIPFIMMAVGLILTIILFASAISRGELF